MTLIVIFGIIIIAYGLVITLAMVGWSRASYFHAERSHACITGVSIIIAAKNEGHHIVSCLKEIALQTFPSELFEIIVVDDASEDDTYERIIAYAASSPVNIRVIRQREHAGKKRCIAAGIEASRGELLITSDADMYGRSREWLHTIVTYYELNKPKLMILPIDYSRGYSLLTHFQALENVALAGMTAGYAGLKRPFLCNGANLAFTREAYDGVHGYASHIQIASGEDVLLLEDIKKHYGRSAIHYLFSRKVIARTYALKRMDELFQQRLRWAYKAKYNSNRINAFIGFIVVAANLVFPALIAGLLQKSPLIYYLSIFAAAKTVFDFLLLFLASDFLGIRYILIFLLPFECIYWLYATVIGLSSVILKPTWKNRKIS